MTGQQRNAVERLVQLNLRQRAAEVVETSLTDESLVREIREKLDVPDTAELRHLIESAGIPIRAEMRDGARRQTIKNFWLSRGQTRAVIIPLLAILLGIGAGLRLDRIAKQSQWLDEYWAVYLATGRGNLIFDLPYGQIVSSPPACGFSGAPPWWHIWSGITSVVHPPLYYLTLRGWIDLFGDGDFSTRAMSLVFSLGAVVLMFDVVRRSSNSTAQGIAAAAMMSLAPAQIDFSQTTRPYTMLVFLGLLVCDLLINMETKGPSRMRTLRLAAGFAALALTHYFCIGAFLAIGIYCLVRLRGRTRRSAVLAMALAIFLVAAAWGPMFWRARHLVALDGYVRGRGVDIVESFVNLPRRLLLHSSLETGFLSMLAFAAVIYLLPPLRLRRHPHLLLWWLWAVCVPGFLLLWDEVRHTHFIGITRYALLASPAIYAIFATPFPTNLGKFVPAAFVFAAAASAFARWQSESPSTPDIRSAAHWIASDVPPGQPIILFGDPDSEPAFNYFAIAHYAGEWNHPVILLQSPASETLRADLARYPHVWIWCRGGSDPRILPGWNLAPARRSAEFSLTTAAPALPNPPKSR